MFPGNRPASVTVDPEVDYPNKTQKTPFPGSRANATRDPHRDGDTSARKTTVLPFGLPFGNSVTHLPGNVQATTQTDNSTLDGEFGESGGISGTGALDQGALDPDHIQAAVPGAPTGVTATAGTTQATVTWTAPASDGGTPITGYLVTPYHAGARLTPVASAAGTTSHVVTGLTTGQVYTFKVAATNIEGTGADSTASGSVTVA